MRQKVISYKKDGNSIKQTYMELEQKTPHVYAANREVTGMGTEIDLVMEINGIYFVNCHCTEERLLKEGNLDKAEQLAQVYMQITIDDEETYPSLLILELFRQAGTKEQVELLVKRREQVLNRRKEKEQQYLEKKKREKEEQERIYEEKYKDAVRKFLSGEYVNPCYAVEMFRRNNMNVHPRTLCNLQNYCSQVSTGSIRIMNKKRSYDGVFAAIKELHLKLTTTTA